MRRSFRVAIATIISLAAYVAATASASASGGYNNVAGEHSGAPGVGASDLPFTGADLAQYVVVGCAIIAGGLVLRAVSRRTVGS
jgi:hypothetical protein